MRRLTRSTKKDGQPAARMEQQQKLPKLRMVSAGLPPQGPLCEVCAPFEQNMWEYFF